MLAIKSIEFVSDRMSYIILRGHWCDIVLNIHAPTNDKIDDVKDTFYEELECVFDKFPKYHMKILLGYFSAKVGREDIFKLTIGTRVYMKLVMIMELVNFAASKNLFVKSIMFLNHNIHKFTWTSDDGMTIKLTAF
jgi:hypothetical protein